MFQSEYDNSSKLFDFSVPYTEMGNITKLYDFVEVIERNDNDYGIDFSVRVNRDKHEHFKNIFGKYLKK